MPVRENLVACDPPENHHFGGQKPRFLLDENHLLPGQPCAIEKNCLLRPPNQKPVTRNAQIVRYGTSFSQRTIDFSRGLSCDLHPCAHPDGYRC